MSKTISLLAGVIAVSAITYKYTNDIQHDRQALRQRINGGPIKTQDVNTLEPLPIVTQSQVYLSQRLIPSLKDSWNAHVTKAAHAVIYSDAPNKIKKFWVKNVLGNRVD
ncbi:hypothetical protein J3Q64DRAFT_1756712 [Phycomyces blakesleeanus]|uniref:Uncharacterized protein n=2 Tax=Phycomyces blakesleeanus TaxID=4837 RepID=A0A167JT70_PHYB8|nr:hypothetical protein PHYBLDRAFT_71912 [Phycomyces blakesleeanus NRRL 1555(-)]OAD66658.1 hypothetical protein PHYBLDRAFT_71912 [Phycomyces blakesleeanus NRRL 1555(-)]|eukprot:XP_018284698.1 hypothetical protein PHYBLDRAFT_71912 [Phycomyces blakesleeanus NRRL 1555(-)]